MVRMAGLEPALSCKEADFLTTTIFIATAFCLQCLWSGLSLHHNVLNALGAARPVSTPPLNNKIWLGISFAKAFPEFEQFYSIDFSMGTQ
ncbi:hypothetical protein [Candidatus Liberibacter solanacearum]|nr:hypothetical protein [Candidatus Liberibacter solanacearum]